VNLSSKSLIFFLNLCLATLLLTLSLQLYAGVESRSADPRTTDPRTADLRTTASRLPTKRAAHTVPGPATSATLGVRFVWQTIRSEGRGTNISTSAETFAADGLIRPVSATAWELRVHGASARVVLNYGNRPSDVRLYIQRKDLFNVLGIIPGMEDIGLNNDVSAEEAFDEPLQIPLLRSASRQMETVFRGKGEELFLVKASAIILPRS